MIRQNLEFEDRDLQNGIQISAPVHCPLTGVCVLAFDIILFTSSDAEEGKESSEKALKRVSSNDFVRLGSQDTASRDALYFSHDILSKGSLDAFDMDHASSDHDVVSWKDIQVAKKHRGSSELTFEQWHSEQLTALEENVYATMSMSHDEYEHSLQSLQVATQVSIPTEEASRADGDGSSSSEDEESSRATKKRPNVREHSKAQREKRKAAIKSLEEKAALYSAELTESNRQFRENLEKYAFRRKYSYETVCNFANMWIRGEQSMETWQVVVEQSIEMTIPFTTTRFRPPGQSLNGRRVLKGVTDIIGDATSLAVMCVSISNQGRVPMCKFQLQVDIPQPNFVIEDEVAMANISIFSKNATLCGGKYEIHVHGMLRCGFSLAGNLQWVDLCYNECDMQQQLLASFGSDVYGSYPNIARMRAMMQQEQTPPACPSESPKSTLITVLDESLLVTDMDATALHRIGPVVGRSLVSADWIPAAVRLLSDWAPYGCELDSVLSDGVPSKIFCTLYPYYDDSVTSEPASSTGAGHTPNRVLWTMRECPSISNEAQIATMIRFVVKRVVDSARIRISWADPDRCPNVLAVLRLALELFDVDAMTASTEVEEVGSLVNLMESFLKWVTAIEGSLWNLHQIEMLEACADDSSLIATSCDAMEGGLVAPVAPMLQLPSQHTDFTPLEREYFNGPNEPVGSVYIATDDVLRRKHTKSSDNIDMSTLADMSSSVDTFFSQLRDPSMCPHIIGLLRIVPSAAAAAVVEEFITHCQTKHTDPKVQILMKDAQEMVRTHRLEMAIEVLDEIIALDSDFVEAYNRRATANYGLRRAQECYADLEQVLSRNPLHFGALCGKGLLMMNLKSYDLAVVAFETVLHINPRLQNDEAILRNLRFCKQYAWQQPGPRQGAQLPSVSNG